MKTDLMESRDYIIAKNNLVEKGFCITPPVFSPLEMEEFLSVIQSYAHSSKSGNTGELFAIRNLLGEIPELNRILWTSSFQERLEKIMGPDYFNTKSLYFDKPPFSNWSVPWHQDTTISVAQKIETEGFGPWTLKQGQLSTRPPLDIMENIIAVRLHLDDCNPDNGALKIVPKSHRLGFIPDHAYPALTEQVEICPVPLGGIMLMKPLLLHSSGKSKGSMHRRVIHLEFASQELPRGLKWSERR